MFNKIIHLTLNQIFITIIHLALDQYSLQLSTSP